MKLGDVTEHRAPLKRVDLGHIGRPRIITREQVEDNIHKEPCAEAYKRDVYGNWHLKDSSMTHDEFNALKPGDKVRNGEGQIAEIVASGPHGHSYQWNGAGPVFNLFAAGNMWRGFSVVGAEDGAGSIVVPSDSGVS